MTTLRNHRIAALLTAGLCAGAALPSLAGSETQVTAREVTDKIEVAVNYADLNVNSPQGQAVLLRRIENAARSVCGSTDPRVAGGLRAALRNEACFEETLSSAMSQIPGNRMAAR